MSLKQTHSTQHWGTISKKCKQCSKAIYTIENDEVYYQCSIFGKFKKDCELEVANKPLPRPEEILKKE